MDPQTHCPDRETLLDFLEGRGTPENAAEIEDHFLHCENCSSVVETISGSDGVTAALKRKMSLDTKDSQLQGAIAKAKQIRVPQETVFEHAAPQPKSGTQTVSLEELSFLHPAEHPNDLGMLGGYRVLEILGAGGMGIVFRAEDPSLQREVALKVMKPAVAADSEAKSRFLREAQATAAIEHDHIVSIYQVGEDEGVPFIAMPLLKGESLKDRLERDQHLETEQAISIARQIALGLSIAHKNGLIHRDIKPDNVWIEEATGRVKIVDFGLVRNTIADADASLTQSGTVMGTPQYMSPEQAGGKPVDGRSDLFSLGVVLYQMLSAKKAFQRKSLLQTLVAVERESPPPLAKIRPETPAPLSQLVEDLIAKNPDERVQSAEELVTMPSRQTVDT